MSLIPIRLVETYDEAINVSGGMLEWRDCLPLGACVFANSIVGSVSGGVEPVKAADYVRALYSQIGTPAAHYQPGVGVTGTLTASDWADQSGNGNDLAQGTAGNQPIYLPYAGSAYAYLPGVASNYFSTPDSAAAGITGDIDVRAYAAADDWTPAALGILVTKDAGAPNRSYILYLNTNGTLSFAYSENGTDLRIATSSVATGLSAAALSWVRATYVSATGKVNFYTGSDNSSWTALGTEQSITAGPIFDSTAIVEVGTNQVGSNPFLGKVYRAQIYNGINGTLAVDFDPSTFVETSTNGTTATASTGEVWTLNSTGAYPATIVKSPQLLFGGVDEYMDATITLAASTVYIVGKQVSWTASDTVLSGNGTAINIYQSNASPKFSLFAGAWACENSSLAVGSFGVVTALFNGAGSLSQVNATSAVTGNTGTPNVTAISLGAANPGAASNFANWIIKEVLIFAAAHNASQRALVQNYLAARHGLVL